MCIYVIHISEPIYRYSNVTADAHVLSLLVFELGIDSDTVTGR